MVRQCILIVSSTQDVVEAQLYTEAAKSHVMLTGTAAKDKIETEKFAKVDDLCQAAPEELDSIVKRIPRLKEADVIVWASSDERNELPYQLAQAIKTQNESIKLYVRFSYLYGDLSEPPSHAFINWIDHFSKMNALFFMSLPGARPFLEKHTDPENLKARAVGHPALDAALVAAVSPPSSESVANIRAALNISEGEKLFAWIGTSEPFERQLPMFQACIDSLKGKGIQLRGCLHPGMGEKLVPLTQKMIAFCQERKAGFFKIFPMGKVKTLLAGQLGPSDEAYIVTEHPYLPKNTTEFANIADGHCSPAFGADITNAAVRGKRPHVLNRELMPFFDPRLMATKVDDVGMPLSSEDQDALQVVESHKDFHENFGP